MKSLQASKLLRHVRHIAANHDGAGTPDRELLERFVGHHDEEAFTTLLRRHSQMVWAVCRSIVGDWHLAEDAFQATFLVLATKAHSIRRREALSCWLHGVARHVAMKARETAARHRVQNEKSAPGISTDPLLDMSLRELQSILHEELEHLPEKYRAPVVLCYLESKTHAQAARQLDWTEGTVRSRVNRGRELLRGRLTRRGLAVPAVLLTSSLATDAKALGLSAGLVQKTAKAAFAIASSKGTATGLVSAEVASLVRSGIQTLALSKLRIVTALLLTLCLVGMAAGTLGSSTHADKLPDVAAEGALSPNELDQKKDERQIHPATDSSGDPLPPHALARLGTTRLRNPDYMKLIAFTPDGDRLISQAKVVRVWEGANWKELIHFAPLAPHEMGTGSLSPDGKLLAVGALYRDNPIVLCETATGRKVREFGNGSYEVVAFSPDGRILAAISHNHVATKHNHVEIWDVATGRQLHKAKAHDKDIWTVIFAPDGKTLLTAGEDKCVRFWDMATGQQLREIGDCSPVMGHVARPVQMALAPDGGLLAVIREPNGPDRSPQWANEIGIWDAATGKELRRLNVAKLELWPDYSIGFQALAFLPDGKLMTAGPDPFLRIWDPKTGRELRRLSCGESVPLSFALAPDAKRVAVASRVSILVLDLASGKSLSSHVGHPDSAYKTAVTPDGRTVVTASGPDLYLWDTPSGNLRHRLQGHHGDINGLEIIDRGRRAVTSAYREGTLRVWDLSTGQEASQMNIPERAGILQAVSPDGNMIAVGEPSSLIVLFDVRTGKEIQRLKGHGDSGVYGAAFTPDGRTLVVWYSDDNMVYLWDLPTGRKIREYPFMDEEQPKRIVGLGRQVYFAAVSPDGRFIAFGSQSRFLELHDLITGELLYRQANLPDGVCPMAFSPDSRLLAWSGWWNDPTVHLVEVASGKDRFRFAGHTGRVLSLSFSPDGTRVISGSDDTTALVWDLTGKLAAGDTWGKPLSTKDIEAAWVDLAGDDAAHAYDAILRLSAAPREPITFLGHHLNPVPAVDDKRLTRLIADLDAEKFSVRQQAAQELEALGEAATEACRKALEANPSAESRRRLEMLQTKQLHQIAQPSPERLRLLRALEVLERAGTAEARQLLQKLAEGASGARLTYEAKSALVRLDRGQSLR
ncbi:MAG TPA: sigma-70 family RNA polymerase sigma factor [Gemmataceae bacterium]|nr:sigma-70 family RNA polymerase sigma factor [Gemmataceae bacterium]